MSYIAYLDLAVNQTLQDERWQELALEEGMPLRDYVSTDYVGIEKFISDASGMVLPHYNFLEEPGLRACICAGLSAGKHLLVPINSNWVERLNPFLLPYGMQGTSIAIYSGIPGLRELRTVEISRAASPQSFRNHPFLDGVESVVVQQPNLISYRGYTSPILTLPTHSHFLVDQSTDYPTHWTSPDMSFLVLSELEGGGAILAVAGGLFHDPYGGPLGKAFLGIAAADNEILARNVLRWLGGASYALRGPASEAFELIDHIERSLVDHIYRRLNRAYQEEWWTQGIPLRVRLKCAERTEEEGNKLPKPAYLDLIDLKAVLESQWPLFEMDFDRVGLKGGKKKALVWLDELNQIRRSIMHPVRRRFDPTTFSASTLTTLKNFHEYVRVFRNLA